MFKCLITQSILVILLSFVSEANVLNRYIPHSSQPESRHRTYLDKMSEKKVEILASFGLTPEMKKTAEKAIVSHYTGIISNSGEEANEIANEMEIRYGGFWMVGIFDADYDMAYTVSRRSRHYGVYSIDDRTILIARDGAASSNFGPVF